MISLRYECWREYKETIADGQNSEILYVGGKPATCTIVTFGNTGKIQFSTSPRKELEANTAIWQDWGKGEVTSTTSDALTSPVTAIRGVSIIGEIAIEMVI